MIKLTLNELYSFHDKMILDNYDEKDIEVVNQLIVEKEKELLESGFTSATGGPAGSFSSGTVGYGSTGVNMRSNVGPVPDQSTGFPGSIGGQNWMDSKSRDGNINIPYNPAGKNRVFQKMKDPMGKGHGAMTGKKSREKKLDLKALKDIFAKNKKSNNTMGQTEKPKKVMNFDDFAKGETTKITKVKEGQAYKSTKGIKDKTIGKEGLKLTDRKESFRNQIESLLKSHKSLEVKRVGNDFEVHKDSKMILQIMFRDGYIGLKKSDAKFTDEFDYNQLGKIKSKINEIVK